MERDQIIREDFEVVRKGWDPDAVRSHLRSIADSPPEEPAGAPASSSLGDMAAKRVRSVLEAAEQAATEIEAAGRADADGQLSAAGVEAERIRTEARAESEALVGQARSDVEGHLSEAGAAVDGLAEQVATLREQVAELGDRLRAGMPQGPAAEVPGPATIPEPTPPMTPEPTPDPVPEPTPDPVPEPTPDPGPPEPTPEPPAPDLPDEPGPIEPPVPEPAPTPPTAGASTDDLIEQLRAGSGEAANGSPAATAVSGSDLGAARLVAMNMALDGASRDEIDSQLRSEFGAIQDLDGLLDEVLARAAR